MSKCQAMKISGDTARDELFHLNLHCVQTPLITFDSEMVDLYIKYSPGICIHATDTSGIPTLLQEEYQHYSRRNTKSTPGGIPTLLKQEYQHYFRRNTNITQAGIPT